VKSIIFGYGMVVHGGEGGVMCGSNGCGIVPVGWCDAAVGDDGAIVVALALVGVDGG
jgi:hypothetical protein